jgi:hypothetical protein
VLLQHNPMMLRSELVQALMETVNDESRPTVRADYLGIWRKLFATFSPLIGHDQVQILFMRSLDAGRHEIPWLPIVYPQGLCDSPLTVFESVSMRQSESQVQGAMRSLLSTYIDLLFALIGTTLTVQFVCNCAQSAPKTKY